MRLSQNREIEARVQRYQRSPIPEPRTLEKALREAGYSRREAKTIVSRGYDALKGDAGSTEARLLELLEVLKD